MEPARFCPRCQREEEYLPEERFCSICRGPLLAQGYCPVCERPWMLAVGQMCPKHELPLVEQPLGVAGEGGDSLINWVTLETYADDTTATAIRLRLETEGISTRLENDVMGSRFNLAIATGGMELMVPEQNLAAARVILDQNWSIPENAGQTDAGEEWEGLAPESPVERRRRVMKAVVWFMIAPSIIAFVIGIIGLVVYCFRGLLGSFSR